MIMMALMLVSWWYSEGWKTAAARAGERVKNVLQFFSVGLLASTLFAPFRQIDAGGGVQGPLDAKLRAFGDQLFSRIFGAFIRLVFIFLGLFCAVFAGALGVVIVVLWPLVPVLPIGGLILSFMGVKP
jgi:hypothetical protein